MVQVKPKFLVPALFIILSVMIVMSGTVIAGLTQSDLPTGPVPGKYIVVFKDGINPSAAAKNLGIKHGLRIGHVYSHAIKGCAASIPEGKLKAIERNPAVKYVEPDLYVHALPQELPTGIDRIDADESDIANIDGSDERVNVDIAIIDTGIYLDHPDLNVVGGVTLVSGGTIGGDDDNGHGTHVAGTAAALDNDVGVVGVAPGARLWAVKVLRKQGWGLLTDILEGIDWVTSNAAIIEVANMSLGGVGQSDAYRAAIKASVNEGVFYAVAAGNSEADVYGPDGVFETADDYIPAAYPEVATVSAMADSDGEAGGADDTLATFSNFSEFVADEYPDEYPVVSPGYAIDLAAPGVDILSTYINDGYAIGSGTSMASPHVAGAAALYIAANGRANDAAGVYAIRQALIDSAEDQGDWGGAITDRDNNYEGLVDAGAIAQLEAVNVALSTDKSQYLDTETTAVLTAVVTDESGAAITGLDSAAFDTTLDDGYGNSVTVSLTQPFTEDLTTSGTYKAVLDISTLAADTYTVEVTVTDTRDISGTDSANFSVVTTAVNVALSTDKSQYLDTDTTAVLTAVVTDESGAAIANLADTAFATTLDGVSVTVTFTETGTSGTYTGNLDISTLAAVTHTVEVTVTDTRGISGTGSATFSVVTGDVNVMHVAGIDMILKTAGINTSALATVTIVDASGNRVEGATVSGHWSGATSDDDTGVTNDSGQVIMESDKVKRAPIETIFTFTVTDVAHPVYTYTDPDVSGSIEVQ